jgi:hypothetical protein
MCNGAFEIELQQAVEFGLSQNTCSKSCQLFLMGMFCLNCYLCFPMLMAFQKCRAWIKKNDGHAWCKVITTNIKNSFGLNFRKMFCLGNFYCVQDDCENFVHSIFRNETFWCNESVHIPIIGQMQLISFASSLDANFVMFLDLLYCWL